MISRVEPRADRVTLRFTLAEAADMAISVDSARRQLPGRNGYTDQLREVLHALYEGLMVPNVTERQITVPMLSARLHKEEAR